MNEHARSPIDLAAIAKHAMVSKRTLNRQFRHHLNTTSLTVLAAIRVEHAKHLLDTTTLTVDRIAKQSGFASYAALRYHFTRIVGVAPHHYRHGRTATTRPMSQPPEPPRLRW
jgi:transcriptional regulator GlxA family with amidase domain